MTALLAGIASAAQPKAGDYQWTYCPPNGGTCPTEAVYFSVKDGKSTKIKQLSYSDYFCGLVEVGPSIKVTDHGSFNFSGGGLGHQGEHTIPTKFKGKFVSPGKAKGTLTINADCTNNEPKAIPFTAKLKRGK